MLISKSAQEINEIIKKNNKTVFNLLSKKGKAMFYPKDGILAQSAQARGKKINATIGIAAEDDGTPMRLPSIQNKINLPPNDIFPYPSSEGRTDLRIEWKKLMIEKNPSLKALTSTPMVTQAITHGLSLVGFLFIDEGDTILSPNYYWSNYSLIFTNGYGAKIETFNTFKDNKIDCEAMAKKLGGGGKKILLLNFPNNPCGYTPSKEESKEIIRTIESAAKAGNKILVICDDAYFGLFYEDETEKESLFAKLADLHENVLAIKLDGATKEDYVWGLRVGFITYAYKGATKETLNALEDKTSGAIRANISMASNLSQSLVLNAIKSPSYKKEKQEKFDLLKQRYLETKRVLKENKNYSEEFLPVPFNSGYFMCIKPLHADPERVRLKLIEKYDTGVINAGTLLRVSFSSVNAKLIPQLFENIYLACKECK